MRAAIMNRFMALIVVALAMLFVVPSVARAQWRVGVARVNITPERPLWLSGYGSRTRPADGKLTDLWAKALVLDDGGQRVVLVTLDLVGIDRGISQRVCREIMTRHKLPRAAIALCSSHTHSGPVVGDNLRSMYFYDETQDRLVREYTRRLEQQLVDLVDRALRETGPATLHYGVGQATFAVNRRNNPEAKVPELRAGKQLVGPVDHGVPVLVVRSTAGETRAIVCGYACHATVLDGYQWSGDWPGFAQLELETRHRGATALFVAGCGADQNPLPRRTVELARDYGRQLADAVDAVLRLPAGELRQLSAPLAASYEEIDLPFARMVTREELTTEAASPDRYIAARSKSLLAALERGAGVPATYPFPVQVWRVGVPRTAGDGLTWVLLGGETVVDYSLRLKTDLGPRTWVTSYANDVMAYIPSRRVLLEGGYEGTGAMVYYGLPGAWHETVERDIHAAIRRQLRPADERAAALAPDHRDLSWFRDTAGKLQEIRTPDDWQRRRTEILAGMQAAMGPLPPRDKLPPLDVRESGRETFDQYNRVTLSYAGHAAGMPRVPSHLYLPKAPGPARRPAMLVLHQTSPQGKRNVGPESDRPNLASAGELAARGYIVLAPDYPSFGDYQFDFAKSELPSGTMVGIVNHIRGVDLLVARDDVDPRRLGVLGHSLGGHNALFVAAFDERLRAVVTSCGWTPFHDYFSGKLDGWTSDRYMPRLRSERQLDPDRVPFDFAEIIASLAPRSCFTNSPQQDDNFDVQGVQRAVAEAQPIYRLLDAAGRLVAEYPAAGHDFPTPTRQAAYRFLDRTLDHTPPEE